MLSSVHFEQNDLLFASVINWFCPNWILLHSKIPVK